MITQLFVTQFFCYLYQNIGVHVEMKNGILDELKNGEYEEIIALLILNEVEHRIKLH